MRRPGLKGGDFSSCLTMHNWDDVIGVIRYFSLLQAPTLGVIGSHLLPQEPGKEIARVDNSYYSFR
jgi:hypothetical protein